MGKFAISSGHGLFVRGAANKTFGMDEVNEARKVVEITAKYLKNLGETVHVFHDNTSKTQRDNINTIVKYHNSKVRDLDISVHFNAAAETSSARGVEVLYVSNTGKPIAEKVSKAIADASGLKNRGAKKRDDLGFLNGTNKPAILIEVCFVDSKEDTRLYKAKLEEICKAIAETVSGKKSTATKTEVKSDGKLYRLFTGTFTSKESAEEMAKKIEKATGLQIRIREE